ncbi:MAG: hypothetical protein ACREL5_13750 [Gemmatimonadales bacterium]
MITSIVQISRRLTAGLVVVAAVVSTACTTTSLVNMWHDPAYPKQPLNRILVVALHKGPAARRVWEDGFVAALKDHGVDATPSYQLFPTADPDTTALLAAVGHRGFEGVLLTHRQSATREPQYVPGYVTAGPGWYRGPWINHYAMYYQRIYAPGYVEINRVVRYEIDLWMTTGEARLVWSGTTASINPASSKQVNREIADQIVPQLVQTGIIAGR